MPNEDKSNMSKKDPLYIPFIKSQWYFPHGIIIDLHSYLNMIHILIYQIHPKGLFVNCFSKWKLFFKIKQKNMFDNRKYKNNFWFSKAKNYFLRN